MKSQMKPSHFPQSVSVFSFISIDYILIDLSNSTIQCSGLSWLFPCTHHSLCHFKWKLFRESYSFFYIPVNSNQLITFCRTVSEVKELQEHSETRYVTILVLHKIFHLLCLWHIAILMVATMKSGLLSKYCPATGLLRYSYFAHTNRL